MTKQETVKIIAILKTAYPKFFISESEAEQKLQIDTWHSLFTEEHYKLVEEAVKSLICTLKYPPTIADVKEKIALITQPQALTEMEAWYEVRAAISYYNAKDNFERLSPLLKKLVGSPNQLREWAVMEADDVEKVVKSNFMRSYTVRLRQDAEMALLPKTTRQLITTLSERIGIADGSD